jgi:hypothetical protein
MRKSAMASLIEIEDLSEGTGDKSVLAIQRFMPWNAMHSHGETYVTVGAGSLPKVEAMTTNANKANDARFIAPAHITLLLLCEATSEIHPTVQ